MTAADLRTTTSDADGDEPRSFSPRRRRRVFEVMLVSGLISFVSAFVLAVEAVTLAKNPDAVFGCDINSVVSCGAVARTWQAQLLGFPNAFIGIVAEAVVITVSVAGIGGVVFPRWFMRLAQAGYTIGLLFAYWLMQQSTMVIGALCPWCLLIAFSTTIVWVGLSRVNIVDAALGLPGRAGQRLHSFVLAGNDVYLAAAWLVLLAALIVAKYGAALFA